VSEGTGTFVSVGTGRFMFVFTGEATNAACFIGTKVPLDLPLEEVGTLTAELILINEGMLTTFEDLTGLNEVEGAFVNEGFELFVFVEVLLEVLMFEKDAV